MVLTDDLGSYGQLEEAGYTREWDNHSIGQFGKTARIENIWSRAKRQLRYQYRAFFPFLLKGLLREWEARHNHPALFDNPVSYLKTTLVPHSLT